MKKFLAITLAFVLVLSMSAAAFAVTLVPSPQGGGGDSSYFAFIPANDNPAVSIKGGKSVANPDDAQKAAIDNAIAKVKELGYQVVQAFFVEKDDNASGSSGSNEAALLNGETIFVFEADGQYAQYDVSSSDINITVTGDCVFVIAKAA